MSTETKYLVMSELIGVPAAAIEKAEEQASRIIQIVQGGWTTEEIDKCSLRGISTVDLVDNAAFIQRAPVATAELITGADIAFLKGKGHTWQEIGITTGLTQDKARHLYRRWQKAQQKVDPTANPQTVEGLVRSMDKLGTFDDEILTVVNRQFPGSGLSVDDIACMRWKA